MKRILSLILLGTVLLSISSCKDDKKSDNIITSKPEKEVIPTDTLAMTTIAPEARTVTWGEGSYTISVKRYADESLPIAIDESGRKYYDNKIDDRLQQVPRRQHQGKWCPLGTSLRRGRWQQPGLFGQRRFAQRDERRVCADEGQDFPHGRHSYRA